MLRSGLHAVLLQCVLAVLDAGTCYLKGAPDVTGGNYSRPGRVACIQKKRSPSPGMEPEDPNMSPSRAGAAKLKAMARGGSACYMKTTADLASKVTGVADSTACIPAATNAMAPFTIKATVPGELLTDLQNAGKVADPLTSNNHKDPSQVAWWNGDVYTYRKNFTHGETKQAGWRTLLVFDGIKLGPVPFCPAIRTCQPHLPLLLGSFGS